jgi:hypothetical protein
MQVNAQIELQSTTMKCWLYSYAEQMQTEGMAI